MDWTDPTASELVEEGEDDMSSLTARFAVRMLKALRGRLPSALQYQAVSTSNGPIQMEKLRTTRLL